MRLLVLGGTKFVGRTIVDDALARGWSVTVLNRGTRPPPPGVTALQGDRTTTDGLAPIQTGTWDIAVDTWSYAPSAVRDAADLLAPRVGHYVYVSSRSVYTFPTPAGADEDAPVVEATRDDDGDVDYARAKAGGELAATTAFGDRALLLRAGVILGPREDVGRLPWWLDRIARGGHVLAPGPADAALQFIDVRDLATWALTAAERQLGGPYNTVSQPGHATMEQLLDACVQVTGADADLVWTDPETILEADVQPWTDLPMWLPPGEAYDTLHHGNVTRAMAAGLHCRPVMETVADTWAWMNGPDGRPPTRTDRPSLGLDPDVEAQVLAAR